MHPSRLAVMKEVEPYVERELPTLLRPVESLWQPADYLPDFSAENWRDQLDELRSEAAAIPDELLHILIGDMVTEEALPTYAQWLTSMEGVGEMGGAGRTPWGAWNRAWSAEEKRHGDALSAYLRLSGRVNMRLVEQSINHLINDGMDIGTGTDPYAFFIYTSFQELATNRSHRNLGRLAAGHGAARLNSMSAVIAGDEGRHAKAYRSFVAEFMKYDADGVLCAMEQLFRLKIQMPAHYLRESGGEKGTAFEPFSVIAQEQGVYTAQDYVEIMEYLLKQWGIEHLTGLSAAGAKAQDYLCRLPNRYRRAMQRIPSVKKVASYQFNWLAAD